MVRWQVFSCFPCLSILALYSRFSLCLWNHAANLSSTLVSSGNQATCSLCLLNMTLFCKTHCHSPLVQWRHLLTSLAALKLENICTRRRLHLFYILCSCTHSTSNVSGTTRGSGDTAVKKADTNPCPQGTHSVAMTNPITGMIWHGSYKATQLMIYIYMQVQKISHPTEEVWGMFTTKFLSGLAKRWLTHTRYGQNASTKHMYWSKKIENNQMPHLIFHSHTENAILFVITRLGSRRQIWAGIHSSHAAFFWRSY